MRKGGRCRTRAVDASVHRPRRWCCPSSGWVLGVRSAALLLPAFNATFSQELSLGLSDPSMLGALVALLLLVSLGAGWYPAVVLSRLDALSAIRRSVSMAGIARV